MKIRRRTAGFRLASWFSWFRPASWISSLTARFQGRYQVDDWLERADRIDVEDPAPQREFSPAPEPAGTSPRTPPEPPQPPPAGWRDALTQSWKRLPKLWTYGTTFLGTSIVGYAIAALILFPAPFLTADQTVPDLIGMSQTDAVARLGAVGLPVPELIFETHPFAERRHVIWQDPPPGVVVPELTSIQLVISNGPQRIPVPDVSGFEEPIARALLEASGLSVGRVENVQTAVPRNVTVNTRPAPGSTLFPGAPVTLVVSVGAPNVPVPDLLGLTRDEARDTLEAVGLTFGGFEWRTSTASPPELIIEQRPAASTLAATGTSVTVFVARSPR